MPELASVMLWAISILLVKHAIADFFLQTKYQVEHKGIYGHPGGLLHAGIHAVLTPAVYLVLPPVSLAMAVLIPAGEFVIHYHVDWLKEQLIARNGWTVQDPWFWRLLGIDQLVHGLTYVAIVAILVADAVIAF